ncbi:hypothetical protein DV515_00013494 [Chloebia gouldiae]|uniref:Uncharacterized protein n=1 Tax=Chloebia gouldiae TaxID=44316 RepID=A0A3L8S0P2_CHLGU|nr:hypothetical protein DV515_00013494 [Chloebia gouldiae]
MCQSMESLEKGASQGWSFWEKPRRAEENSMWVLLSASALRDGVGCSGSRAHEKEAPVVPTVPQISVSTTLWSDNADFSVGTPDSPQN